MRTELNSQQIDSYRENGFFAIESFLDSGELALWREVFDEAMSERTTRMPDGGVPGVPEPVEGEAQIFTQRLQLWESNERMRKLLFDPRLGELACELEGIDGVR